MSFIVLPRAQATLARKALAQLEGLSRRAVVYKDGQADPALSAELGPALDTTDSAPAGDDDGEQCCFELPEALEKHAGAVVDLDGELVTLPTLAELVDEADLPASLKAVRQAKRDAAALALGFPPEEPPP
jgi:hypothetical protein